MARQSKAGIFYDAIPKARRPIRIGLIHLSQRYDSWGKYLLWGLRKFFPQHVAEMCGLNVDVDEFQWASPNYDIYIRIEDSGTYEVPLSYRPLIYWCGDSHIPDGAPRKQIAHDADFTFVAQKNAVGDIGDEWLSHSAWYSREGDTFRSPSVSAAMVLDPDACSIFRPRTTLATEIRDRYGACHVTIRSGIYFKRMADLYGRSQVVWHHSVGNDVAMRHFEGAACGAGVVCSRVIDNGIEDVFGDLLFQYDTNEELFDILDRAADPRKALGEGFRERGRELHKLVTAKHMYRNRLERLVEKCQELAGYG